MCLQMSVCRVTARMNNTSKCNVLCMRPIEDALLVTVRPVASPADSNPMMSCSKGECMCIIHALRLNCWFADYLAVLNENGNRVAKVLLLTTGRDLYSPRVSGGLYEETSGYELLI